MAEYESLGCTRTNQRCGPLGILARLKKERKADELRVFGPSLPWRRESVRFGRRASTISRRYSLTHVHVGGILGAGVCEIIT